MSDTGAVVREYFMGEYSRLWNFESEQEARDFVERCDEPGVEFVVVPNDD